MKYVIGIDVGTSGTKTVLFDEKGGITASVSAEYPLYTPAGGMAEQDAEEARRLYTAHLLTMYARTALPDGAARSKAAIAEAGQAPRQITGKKAGEVSVTYAAGASSAFSLSAETADLAETDFGLQLLALVSRHRRPVYVP